VTIVLWILLIALIMLAPAVLHASVLAVHRRRQRREQWPALKAFDNDDELALWEWTYRVWNGWKWKAS
jgi:hypothetical protein